MCHTTCLGGGQLYGKTKPLVSFAAFLDPDLYYMDFKQSLHQQRNQQPDSTLVMGKNALISYPNSLPSVFPLSCDLRTCRRGECTVTYSTYSSFTAGGKNKKMVAWGFEGLLWLLQCV